VIRDDEATCKETSPNYRYASTVIYSSGFAHVALGIARGFMEDFLELAIHKTPRAARGAHRLPQQGRSQRRSAGGSLGLGEPDRRQRPRHCPPRRASAQ